MEDRARSESSPPSWIPPLEVQPSCDPGPSPGKHWTHYAPRAEVMLLARSEIPARAQIETQRGQRVVVLAPGALPVPPGVERIDIPEDLPALARILYALLREVDQRGFSLALIEMPSCAGLGLAVHDRLSRASGG